MKTPSFFVLVITAYIIILPAGLRAQHRGDGEGMDKPRPERLEKFRKMRLIEYLKLDEENAVRFFAKQSAHEDTQREIMKGRNSTLDDLADIVKGKGNTNDLPKLTGQVQAADQKIFNERQRYQEEMKKFLSPDQFAKFLLFERNFNRQIRDALDEMRDERRPGKNY